MSNFYIIGSKYGSRESSYSDIFPELVKKSVIAIGFASSLNLKNFLGKNPSEISSYLTSNGEKFNSQSALMLFLNIRPGDLIAVKRHSAPERKKARLVIGGYAIVRGETAPIYSQDEELGHTIAVDFIETDEITLPYGYGRTIHKLVDKKRIQAIFGNYGYNKTITQKSPSSVTQKANINPSLVSTKAGYIMTKTHNIMQNALYIELKRKYDEHCKIKMEENFIDISVETDTKLILYEIKSYMSVKYCIREAVGQLLHYDWKLKSHKQVEYIVVGPNKALQDDEDLIQYIRSRLKVDIQYQQKYV